jgi:membrane protein DedA with SNARE-associated domain
MLDSLTRLVTAFMQRHNSPLGLALLALGAFVEYVLPPFPGDTVTLFGGFLVMRHGWSMPLAFTAVLVGSGCGAMVDFYVGVWMSRRYREGTWVRNPATRRQVERVLDAFRRHGELYVAINRFLPALRAVFFVAAGLAGLRPLRVLLFALLSAALWNTLILAVGSAVGAHWDKLQSVFQTYTVAVWAALGALAAALLIRWLVRRRSARP